MPKLGTRNVLFGYFWDGIGKNTVIFEISIPELPLRQFSSKNLRSLKFMTKTALFGCFRARI